MDTIGNKLHKAVEYLGEKFDFKSKGSVILWLAIAIIFVPLSSYLRVHDLSNPLLEPHPIRQAQTALTIKYLALDRISVWDYSYPPKDGSIWSFVVEFPFYQWLVSQLVRLGGSIEICSRVVTLFFFILGLFFFFNIVRHFSGKSIAVWAVLLCFISPFNIIYSRTCLIDTTALTLMLGSLYFVLLLFKLNTSRFYLYVSMAFIFGSLSSVVKPTVWYSPTSALFIYVLYQSYKKKIPRKNTGIIIAQMVLQLVIALIWIKHANFIRGQSGGVFGQDTQSWILGTFSQRLDPQYWWLILRPAVRSLYHDWMVIPFFIAFFGPQRKMALFLIAIAVFSMLGPFNVHCYHDYYLIAEAPYLFAIAAMGMSSLFKIKKPYLILILIIMSTVIVHRLVKFQYVYGILLRDYRGELSEINKLKELTSPDELVYVEDHAEAWHIPLYSERLVILAPSYKSSLSPSVFQLKEDGNRVAVLRKYDRVWVDGSELNYPVFRVREEGKFLWDSQRHILVSKENPKTGSLQYVFNKKGEISACKDSVLIDTIRAPQKASTIRVSVGDKMFFLPFKRYLFLPSHSKWGCRYSVSFDE